VTKAPVILGQGYYWEDLSPGDRFRTHARTLTEADLVSFVGMTGMLESIFIDRSFEGAIVGRPVPAVLTHSVIEGLLLQTMLQRAGLALLELAIKPLVPVIVGDTLHAEVTILEVKPTSRGGRAVVKSEVDVFRQNGEAVMKYTVSRLQAGRATASSAP
jgi:3-hydroxybutyryl-CoA dehydratase